jgi:large subunit ribosomal protein L12
MKKKVNEMEYVYAAMLLHSAEKDIDDKAVSSVLKAAGVEADGARVKALVASLGSVDIDEAMATAVAAPVASAAPAASSGGAADAAPAQEEAAEEPEEEAGGFEGLGSLFG